MPSLKTILAKTFEDALSQAFPQVGKVDALLSETKDKKFGDYQANLAMGLGKQLSLNPRDVAQKLVAVLQQNKMFAKIEVAGPGFINLHLEPTFLAETLKTVLQDVRLGIPKVANPIQHVVDFSSVNLAKEMHIGHLRTTVTGEVICRVLEFLGHPVERVNHVGDWGTPFGMLLELISQNFPQVLKDPTEFQVQDLETFYKQAKAKFDSDADFAKAARERVVQLQAGHQETLALWQIFLNESLKHCHDLYKILGVTLIDRGESFYNPMLADVVKDMRQAEQVVDDAGAVCFFSQTYKNREGEPQPLIVQKNDGGYNYATTDLAAIRYRVGVTRAKRLVYITDIRQAQHFTMVFEAARAMGWADASVDLQHIGYGMILSKDRKPFKTRSGDNVRLKDVLFEAIKRSGDVLKKSDRGLDEAEQNDIAQKVGLAAVKYYDLSHNLANDYVFDWEQMLAMEGNTGPYMLYAYARLLSIARKAGVDYDDQNLFQVAWNLEHESELGLAKMLLQFGDVIEKIAQDLKPNILTDYLYNLCKVFNTFYDKNSGVSVLNADTPEQKQTRLGLCALTAKILFQGLNLLSIDVVQKM